LSQRALPTTNSRPGHRPGLQQNQAARPLSAGPAYRRLLWNLH